MNAPLYYYEGGPLRGRWNLAPCRPDELAEKRAALEREGYVTRRRLAGSGAPTQAPTLEELRAALVR